MESCKKIIYCPNCNKRVASWDKKSTSNIVADCRNCRKRIVYHVDTDEVEIKKIPPRPCGSGLTFY